MSNIIVSIIKTVIKVPIYLSFTLGTSLLKKVMKNEEISLINFQSKISDEVLNEKYNEWNEEEFDKVNSENILNTACIS